MDCTVISAQLIAYYFATSTDSERDAVDRHLLECTRCLRVYLQTKHHLERGADRSDAPSERVRLRLRNEVRAAFRPTAQARVRTWLARPIPLYQGLAAAVVAVVLAALGPAIAHRAPHAPAATITASGQYIDTSRRAAENLTVY